MERISADELRPQQLSDELPASYHREKCKPCHALNSYLMNLNIRVNQPNPPNLRSIGSATLPTFIGALLR